MIQWVDEGIIVSVKRQGEHSALMSIFTPQNGRYAGFFGGARKGGASTFIKGTSVRAQWKARLSEHVGAWKLECLYPFNTALLDHSSALLGFDLICHYISFFLPERQPYSDLYRLFFSVTRLQDPYQWAEQVALFEKSLLSAMGFGLKLERCTVTNMLDDLAYVSPRSGCAVSREAGKPYHAQLFAFPNLFRSQNAFCAPASSEDTREALGVTGYFLQKHFEEKRFGGIFTLRKRWTETLWPNKV